MRYPGTCAIVMMTLLVGMTAGAASDEPPAERSVLLVIDVQDFYFDGGFMPLEGSVEASLSAAAIIERFRALAWPVVHVQHLPKDRSTPGQDVQPAAYRIHENVVPIPGETVIGKHHANSFRDTNLLATLQQLEARHLVIVGMQTHMCVEAATRAAADLGFQVTVVHDACATRALEHGDTTVAAADVHASTLASLDRSYARIIGGKELLAELPAPAPQSTELPPE